MDTFDKEFMMEMFLDSDSVTTMNRLAIAVADVVSENSENISMITEVLSEEHTLVAEYDSEESHIIFRTSGRRRGSRGYYENIVVHYTDEDYKDKYMMNRRTVQALINLLKDLVPVGVVPLDKKVHVFLWLLTSDLSYNEIASLFCLHKSSVNYIFYEIISALAEQRYNYITWPSVEEQHITRLKVQSRFKFPNCVGFIDACRIKVGSKTNKKDKPSIILLQAVCDESLTFIDVHIGNIGKTKKHKVFKESALAHELNNFVEFDNHILGDSQYKLNANLITPFTTEEILTSEEMKFNEIHWKTRMYIGYAFELLKERFKKLNYLDINKQENVSDLLCATCVLHNFVLIHEGVSGIKEEVVMCEEAVTMDPSVVTCSTEKRQFLCNYINYMDNS